MKKITLLISALALSFSASHALEFSEVAMITEYQDVSTALTSADDDEIAAIEWFKDRGGKVIGTGELYNSLTGDNTINLNQYKALWIHIDRETTDINTFLNNCTGGATGFRSEAVLSALTNYYKNGGNLLLTSHASILLKDLGRMDRYPEVIGFGEGFTNQDTFFANVVYGTWNAESIAVDNSGDPLFTGIEMQSAYRPEADGGREYKVFPLIGPGWKEDHNCFWHFDYSAGNDDPEKFKKLYADYQVTPLAIWPHISDYYGGAIARWDANTTYKGRCITIGFAAYEWSQNLTNNIYQGNIELLTFNALNELVPKTSGIVDTIDSDDAVVDTKYYTTQGIEVSNPDSKGIYIVKSTLTSGKKVVKKIVLGR